MKKKVLFLIHTLGAGGAEKVLVNLVNHMSDTYNVTVMTIIDTGVFRREISPKVTYKTMFKIPFMKEKEQASGSLLNNANPLKKQLAKFYSFIWRYMPTKFLYRWKVKEKYDIEVSFLEGICAKVIASSKNDSKKYAWIHVDLIHEKKSEKFFLNRKQESNCYNQFDKIVAVSENVREQFIKKFNYSEDKIVVKYNAIHDKDIMEKAIVPIKIKEKTKFTIISVGRLSIQKGYDRLLKICKKLKEETFDFELWILGVGPEEENLKNYIEKNHLENMVFLLGFQSNPYPFMKCADLFVCSSRAEGFSTVASEAAILEIPIVTTDCSGMRELLGDSDYGLITENCSDALYKGIKKMLLDKQLFNRYKKQIVKAKNRFSLDKSVKDVEEMFGEVL